MQRSVPRQEADSTGRSTSSLWLLPLTGDAIVVTVQPGPISGFAPIKRGGAGGSGRIAVAIVDTLGRWMSRRRLPGTRGIAVIRGTSILPARRALILRPGDGGLRRSPLLRSLRCRGRAVDDGGHRRRGVDNRGHRRRGVDNGHFRRGSIRRIRTRSRSGGGTDPDTEEEAQKDQNERQRLAEQFAMPRCRPRGVHRNGVGGRRGCGRERGSEGRSHGGLEQKGTATSSHGHSSTPSGRVCKTTSTVAELVPARRALRALRKQAEAGVGVRHRTGVRGPRLASSR